LPDSADGCPVNQGFLVVHQTEDAIPKRVALYLRVSTDAQATENQRLELERVVQQRGWQVVATYEDAGISGARDAMSGLVSPDVQEHDALQVRRHRRLVSQSARLLPSRLGRFPDRSARCRPRSVSAPAGG